MNLSCHECHNMVKPFYNICMVIGSKPDKIAFSECEFDLCKSHYDFVSSQMKKSLDRLNIPVGYILSGVTEVTANLKKSMESPLAVYDRGPYSFLEKTNALYLLPKTAGDLLTRLEWVEKNGNDWKKADWAYKMHELFL